VCTRSRFAFAVSAAEDFFTGDRIGCIGRQRWP
jgi:hypothetical protein